jgi:hypothetical protein
VLIFAVQQDGGMLISATQRELRTLAQWILLAAETGHEHPTFAADEGLAHLTIERDRDD